MIKWNDAKLNVDIKNVNKHKRYLIKEKRKIDIVYDRVKSSVNYIMYEIYVNIVNAFVLGF